MREQLLGEVVDAHLRLCALEASAVTALHRQLTLTLAGVALAGASLWCCSVVNANAGVLVAGATGLVEGWITAALWRSGGRFTMKGDGP